MKRGRLCGNCTHPIEAAAAAAAGGGGGEEEEEEEEEEEGVSQTIGDGGDYRSWKCYTIQKKPPHLRSKIQRSNSFSALGLL